MSRSGSPRSGGSQHEDGEDQQQQQQQPQEAEEQHPEFSSAWLLCRWRVLSHRAKAGVEVAATKAKEVLQVLAQRGQPNRSAQQDAAALNEAVDVIVRLGLKTSAAVEPGKASMEVHIMHHWLLYEIMCDMDAHNSRENKRKYGAESFTKFILHCLMDPRWTGFVSRNGTSKCE